MTVDDINIAFHWAAWMAEGPQKPAATKQARLEAYFSPLPTMKSPSAPNPLDAHVLPAPTALTAASVATSVPATSASSHQDPEILGTVPHFANEADEISYNEHKVTVSEQPEWVPCCENPDATVYKDGRYKGPRGKFSAAAPHAGHKYIMIWLPGDKSVALHRLVYFSYYPENQKFAKERNYVVDHIDGNPLNNKLENLRLLTVAQNTQSAHDVGLVDKTNLATNVEFVYEDGSTETFVFLKDAAKAANIPRLGQCMSRRKDGIFTFQHPTKGKTTAQRINVEEANFECPEGSEQYHNFPDCWATLDGQVWKNGRFLKAHLRSGYLSLMMTNSAGQRVLVYVHDFIARAHLPKPSGPGRYTVDHIKSDEKLNNAVSNLRWATGTEQNAN
jgi:hypothetical protein